jgi:hypothetical protein
MPRNSKQRGKYMAGQPIAFSFTVDNFVITETRSRHKDTDFVSCTLEIDNADGTKASSRTNTKSMGDLNNGTYPVVLTFPNALVSPGQTVRWNYSIVNAGNAPLSKVESGLENVGNSIIGALVKGLLPAGGTAAAGAVAASGVSLLSLGGTVAVAVAAIFATSLEGLLTANCDGPVAAEGLSATYDQLVAMTTVEPYYRCTTQHPGKTSPAGCGENSDYWVNWHIDKGPYTFWGGSSIAPGNLNHGGPPTKLK